MSGGIHEKKKIESITQHYSDSFPSAKDPLAPLCPLFTSIASSSTPNDDMNSLYRDTDAVSPYPALYRL